MKTTKVVVLTLALLCALAQADCINDEGCSLNGVCTRGLGVCLCDDGWTSDDCGMLDLLPAPSDTSFHGLDVNKSSWGGSVLHLPIPGTDGKEKQWVMFSAEMTKDCTLAHWTTNSEVVLALSSKATGPYIEQFQIIPPWAHNPEAILTDNEVVVYTLGDGVPVHGGEFPCDGTTTPPPTTKPPTPSTPPPTPGNAVHNVSLMIHHAPVDQYTNKSAWQAHNATIMDFPVQFQWEGNWNPAPVALPDGRVRIMVHTGYSGFLEKVVGWSGEVIVEAETWRGPYRMITSRDITNCTHCEEDPFMWVDHRQNWHAIFHRMFDNGTCDGYSGDDAQPSNPAMPCDDAEGMWSMGHIFSSDGLTWSPITRAANTTAQLQDGSSVSFVSRERPKLVFGDDGRPAFLSNAVQPPQAGAKPDSGVTHTLVVPLNVKQNRN